MTFVLNALDELAGDDRFLRRPQPSSQVPDPDADRGADRRLPPRRPPSSGRSSTTTAIRKWRRSRPRPCESRSTISRATTTATPWRRSTTWASPRRPADRVEAAKKRYSKDLDRKVNTIMNELAQRGPQRGEPRQVAGGPAAAHPAAAAGTCSFSPSAAPARRARETPAVRNSSDKLPFAETT